MDKEFELNKDKYTHAIDFIKKAHEGQFRTFSMAPYYTHPIHVATLVMKFKQSHAIDDLVLAALLHDAVEDHPATCPLSLIKTTFNERVASLVEELTSDKIACKMYGKTLYLVEKMNKMTSWALVIKLCDRLDNVMDFLYADKKFIARYTLETETILRSLEESYSLTDTHKKIITMIKAALSFKVIEMEV